MSADFDEAIDGAVREMLDVEPRADLRDRVVASASRRNHRVSVASAFGRNRVLVCAAAAAILLAVFVARRSEPVAPQAPVVAHGDDVRLPSAIAPSPAIEVSMRAARNTSAPARARATVAAASLADNSDVALAGIEPLKRIAPIAIAPITQDSIAPAGLAMSPLNPISEVQIAPLTPPDRRN